MKVEPLVVYIIIDHIYHKIHMDTFSIEKKKYEPTSKHVKAVD